MPVWYRDQTRQGLAKVGHSWWPLDFSRTESGSDRPNAQLGFSDTRQSYSPNQSLPCLLTV